MEKYSLKNAQIEANEIRNYAQEAKQKRVIEGEKNGEPARDDYDNADKAIDDIGISNRKEFEQKQTEIQNKYLDVIEESKNSGNQESVKLLQDNMNQELSFIDSQTKKFNSLEFKKGREMARDYIKKNNLDKLVEKFGIEPMKEGCRLSLVIPACNEGRDIQKTLQSLSEQKNENGEDVDPDEFEVLITVNQKEPSDDDRTPQAIDKFKQIKKSNLRTLEAIEEFKKNNPALNIHAILKEFTGEQGGVGWARKLGSDLALARSFNRNQESEREPMYIAGTDADTIVGEHYISEIIKAANKHGDAAYGGGVIFDENWEKALGKDASDKLRVFMEDMRGFLLKALNGGLQGANFAIREDIYARMGGSSTKVHSEDAENDERLRGLKKNVTFLNSNHITSSRRMIGEFEKYITGMRGQKIDWEARNKSYGKSEPTGEKVDFTESELDEVIAYHKLHRSDLIIDNITSENVNNPEMVQLIGKKYHSDFKNLKTEEFKVLLDDKSFRKKLQIEIAYNMSNLFASKIPYTEKDKFIIGIPEKQ
jgi:glycosyltransferase involved in cell wall biosynthesis